MDAASRGKPVAIAGRAADFVARARESPLARRPLDFAGMARAAARQIRTNAAGMSEIEARAAAKEVHAGQHRRQSR